MESNNNQSNKTNTTFRFASGQILNLDDDQIVKIPYLTAMVSSADQFESARDQDGNYKLDPNIDYQHFSYALRSLSFKSVRQIFTNLPEEENVIPIIALLDFLGLIPSPLPTFKEVDSSFFSTVVYSPYCKKYLRIVNTGAMQDMAVRFSIALIKEEYDFDECEVMDQIYWFVMFILSIRKYFGPRLRHHVHRIAKNCFSVFKPSLLERLEQLQRISEKQTEKYYWFWQDDDISRNEELYSLWPSSDYINFYNGLNEDHERRWRWYHDYGALSTSSFLSSIYENKEWFPVSEKFRDNDPLESIYNRVLEIMYVRLQTEICENARAELQQQRNPYAFVQRRRHIPISFHSVERKILPKKIDDIFKTQLVQEEIDAVILQDLCLLTPVIEDAHSKLVKAIRRYEKGSGNSDNNILYFFIRGHYYSLTYENAQDEVLSFELLLTKLRKDSYNIMEQIRNRVFVELSEVALKQFNEWKNTHEEIDKLRWKLEPSQRIDETPHAGNKNSKFQEYQLFTPKPILFGHLKGSRGQSK